jgi:hypothetical protein
VVEAVRVLTISRPRALAARGEELGSGGCGDGWELGAGRVCTGDAVESWLRW